MGSVTGRQPFCRFATFPLTGESPAPEWYNALFDKGSRHNNSERSDPKFSILHFQFSIILHAKQIGKLLTIEVTIQSPSKKNKVYRKQRAKQP